VAVKTLVIAGTDRDHFFLSLDRGTLRIGDAANHPEGVLRDLRVLRIRCEVEVEDERESVPIDKPGVIAPTSLLPGAGVKLDHAEVSLSGDTALETPALTTEVAPIDGGLDLDLSLGDAPGEASASAEVPVAIERRFKVIDGGDQGRSFPLPEEGTVSLGKHGYADIGLHDLYVSKVHCLVHIDGYRIMVSHVEGQTGTMIDGMRIAVQQKLHVGSVLRIGNSHLKLEQGPFPEEPKKPVEEEPPPPPKKRVKAEVVAEPPKDPLEALEGQAFGHFKLKKLLGRGYVGAAFVALDEKSGQTVIVKVLGSEFPAAPEELNRFIAEFKVAQAIRHPNLVALLGAGRSGAHCWFSRELVQGESAADVIRRAADGSKPSWTRAARTAVLIGRALDELHRRKLTHGNITPNNVLLDKQTHAVKLADLKLMEGLAGSKLLGAVMQKKVSKEAAFAPPEGGVCDLYSLGALVYAMIAGAPPEGPKPPKPSSFYRKTAPEFDRVVMRLIAHDPDRRYRTAAELLDDMQPISEANDLKLDGADDHEMKK
jgi:serine/threonine-protein kinase